MKLFVFTKPVIWLGIICYGLFIPAQELPVKPLLKIPHFDKIVHFVLFFILCLLFFRPFKKLRMNYLIWATSTSVFLGIVLESVQHMISPSRSSDFYDFLANATGIAVSILFFQIFVSGKKWEKLF